MQKTNLKSTIFIGNFNQLNDIIPVLMNNPGTDVMNGLISKKDNPGYSEINKIWRESNFNADSMQWINYYPEKDFDSALVTNLSKYLNLKGVHRSWISRLNPGYFAPWHWDVDDNEETYLLKGEIKRYSIMLCKPTMGHIFIVGEDYLYNIPVGSIFKWKNYKEWHTGINAGMTPKFTLHILGY